MKKTNIRILQALLTLCAVIAPPVFGEDIDIYGGSGGSALPNIVIVFDNASRNNSNYSGTCPNPAVTNITNLQDATRCALAVVADKISQQPSLLGQFRVGIVTYGFQNNQGGQWILPGGITPGAQGVSTPLPLMDQAGINSLITSVSTPINTANEASASGGMQEAWAFLTGDPRAGTEPKGSNTTYSSKIGLACQKSFIIFIGAATGNNGAPETGSNGSGGAGGASGLANAGATAAQQVQINTSNIGPNTGEDSAWGDEWARFLYQTDFNNNQNDRQNIVTYTLATGGTRPNYVQFLQSMATQGGGKAFVAADINAMVQALLQIFNEIAAVNSVFASSSLPVSANTQGTYLNQVFIGMFRPDGGDGPRWLGNLKQYQFGVGGTAANPTLFLADALGVSAISAAGTGFISPNAVSFWTSKNTAVLPDSIGGFYVNNPQSAGGGFDSPDGELVEKGGVGQQIRLANLQDNYVTNPSTPRNLYTCTGSCAGGTALSATPFATSNSALNAGAFSISNPTFTWPVTSISRDSSTGIVTVNLTGTPTNAISDPTTVTISGSTSGQFDGSLASASPSTSGATVTYTLPAQYPPIPPVGTYTVTGPGAVTTNVTNLQRDSRTGYFNATATLADITFGGGAAPLIGDTINITNSANAYYDSSALVTGVSGNTFTYRQQESPAIAGTATQISNTNGSANGITLTRGTTCSGCTSGNSGKILVVTVSGGTKQLNSSSAAVANGTFIKVTGATPSNYTNTTTGWQLVGTGTACTVQYYNAAGVLTTTTATANSGSGKNTVITTFCLDLGSSFTISPATAVNGSQSSPTQTVAARTNPTVTSNIASFAITTASNCPTTANETVEVTTAANHGYTSGSGFTIATNNAGPNEAALAGSGKTITVTAPNKFTYSVTTTPTCTDNKSGMQITYQSAANSINVTDFIRWVRGEDNRGDEQSPGNAITIRPSVHGDVVHSRPAVVNYGGSIGVVVFYGANDGVFRAINGNQPIAGGANIGSTPPGGELWGFIPTEFFSKLPRLYQNSPVVKLSTTPTGLTPTPTAKDYFFDGTTSVYQDAASGKVYLFLSARRGARLIYALDVSSPTAPVFLWKKTEADIAQLGYTFSAPRAARVRGYVDGSGNAKPVVIFGGGYDLNEDSEPPSADTMGRGIYILDATDGSLVWKAEYSSGGGTSCVGTPCNLAGMAYGIAADITLVNRDFDTSGYIDRLYAADLGGNIWRVDLEVAGYAAPASSIGPSTWQVTKFASLGGSAATKRKFFFPPDIVATKNFDVILASTGDREHPMYSASTTSSYAIKNRFYALKDLAIGTDGSTNTTITDGTSGFADSSVTGLTTVTIGSSATTYNPATNDNGFYITLPNAGEKGVNAPVTVGGFTYFGTSTPPVPNALACNNLGTARGYQVNFLTGSTQNTIFDGGGLPPSPVVGLVEVNVNGSPRAVPFCLGCGIPGQTGPDSKSPLGGGKPPIPVKPIRKRVYWYIDKHDV